MHRFLRAFARISRALRADLPRASVRVAGANLKISLG